MLKTVGSFFLDLPRTPTAHKPRRGYQTPTVSQKATDAWLSVLITYHSPLVTSSSYFLRTGAEDGANRRHQPVPAFGFFPQALLARARDLVKLRPLVIV